MKALYPFLAICALALLSSGCDRKSSSQANEKLTEIQDLQREHNQKLIDEIDSEGVASIDEDYVGIMADKFDDMADDLNSEEAAIIRDQADTLRQIQVVIEPYMQKLNEFLGTGGLDPLSIGSKEDIGVRLELIDSLIELNEEIDLKYPPLLRKLGGDPATVAQTIGLTRDIRQADRDLFPHMNSYLLIIQDNWDSLEITEIGELIFDDSVPDQIVNDFNVHADQIQIISQAQGQLQRALVELSQP